MSQVSCAYGLVKHLRVIELHCADEAAHCHAPSLRPPVEPKTTDPREAGTQLPCRRTASLEIRGFAQPVTIA